MLENDISYKIRGCIFEVYKESLKLKSLVMALLANDVICEKLRETI